ncbi:hypothetical protein ACIBCO_22240 [Streptomyces violascens]|uniref:hypothetical protein n=1 Tax=Streptomyces violascens TaxID=67381 RepID=UPI00379FC33C
MSNTQREREKWRNKRRQEREALSVFSAVKPVQRMNVKMIRHTRAEWDAIPQEIYRRNNGAITGVDCTTS